ISDTRDLGAPTSAVNLNTLSAAATLQLTGAVAAAARPITMGTGGTLDTLSNDSTFGPVGTYAGGTLTKAGTGSLTISTPDSPGVYSASIDCNGLTVNGGKVVIAARSAGTPTRFKNHTVYLTSLNLGATGGSE